MKVLQAKEAKVELFGLNVLKEKERFQQKHLTPTIKHGGGGVMIYGCFPATEPGFLTATEMTTNSSLHHSILQSNIR